jgi:hypothetical protein
LRPKEQPIRLSSQSIIVAALVLASAIALFQTVRLIRISSRPRRLLARRAARARQAEVEAETLLQAQGYAVLERQPRTTWALEVDRKRLEVELRADLLVRRQGRTCLVEIKSGNRAPDPQHGPTRRQLLEYALAYDADSILLLDMDQRRVAEVSFPDARPERARARWPLIGLLLLLVAALLLLTLSPW